MNFQFYYEKLIDSEEYQKFVRENPDAYPCSGFFAMDKENEGKDNRVHFDFWLPGVEKMYSFSVHGGPVEFVNVENYDKRPFEKIGLNYDFDLRDFEKMILERKESEKIKGSVQKLLFSLQKFEGRDYLVTTVFLNNFGMLKINIDVAEKGITSFEKKSFMDMFKIIKNKG